jgi:hypothetical protein
MVDDAASRSRAPSKADDPFYVGYLPAPIAHLRLLRVVLPVFTLVIIGCGVLAAAMTPLAGDGVWETGEIREWTGTLRMDPYPRLVVDGLDGQGPGERGESLLLVEMGKFGAGRAQPRELAGYAGQRMRARGYWLTRDGRRMIELDASDDAIGPEPIDPQSANDTATGPVSRAVVSTGAVSMGAAVVLGEIVDFKCYLGAMRPGEGLLHRACAQLCVSGGVPPVLISREPDGSLRYDLLVGAAGEPLNTADAPIIPVIGRPVEVRGERYDWDGLTVMRAVSVEPVDDAGR